MEHSARELIHMFVPTAMSPSNASRPHRRSDVRALPAGRRIYNSVRARSEVGRMLRDLTTRSAPNANARDGAREGRNSDMAESVANPNRRRIPGQIRSEPQASEDRPSPGETPAPAQQTPFTRMETLECTHDSNDSKPLDTGC